MSEDIEQPPAPQLPERGSSQYTAAEIEKGLVAVAWCSGNTRKAARQLEEAGTPIPRTTLQNWATETHVADYDRIKAQALPTIYGQVASDCLDIATDLAERERELIDRLKETTGDLKPAEAASALRNATVAKAVNIDKASVIHGRPTEIREDRSMADIIKGLERFDGIIKLNTEAIESTAEELDDPSN